MNFQDYRGCYAQIDYGQKSYVATFPNGGQRVHALPYPNGIYRIIVQGSQTANIFTIIEGLIYNNGRCSKPLSHV